MLGLNLNHVSKRGYWTKGCFKGLHTPPLTSFGTDSILNWQGSPFCITGPLWGGSTGLRSQNTNFSWPVLSNLRTHLHSNGRFIIMHTSSLFQLISVSSLLAAQGFGTACDTIFAQVSRTEEIHILCTLWSEPKWSTFYILDVLFLSKFHRLFVPKCELKISQHWFSQRNGTTIIRLMMNE